MLHGTATPAVPLPIFDEKDLLHGVTTPVVRSSDTQHTLVHIVGQSGNLDGDTLLIVV